ncbi:glycosyl transferase [Streptomyces avermitilis]|uniref:Glycosyltransferase, secreted n=2 Tax=Streptomyces avermitilis TaxID=33903 RepID=Q82EY0_STRAW|nr:glycosyl transferase [Streptomyces avermitilis]MYT00070.1 undecaprenyl/decaprenyl-phosphate alpha-N-acetylglucosaminyl 1-phosphate transferase [Streptomyces sp. SID5469]KUN51505.1 glycosyl transferase [Streptomyces avermitilis]OOV31724.1 undecaprenyl-phosphate alpha-N-acetylglucosaminyl 1-phosphate transferase [Streptomyces avermitilis]BAC72195.1 putative glycosyltransferase, secreted [Streptomyces avermitilis MA-4680 = NBRC 14893]GDY64542.1 putative glycosyltransferase [Streptomyces avermi
MLYGIIAATSALLLASALAAVLRVPALRLGLVERRRGRTVSRLGGAAVVVGTVVVAGVGDWSGVARLGTGVGELLVVGAGVGALGLVADLRPVPRVVRLAGQAAAAAAVVPYDELGAGAGLFAAAWIVLVTSAFGSLDQADGVMGTVGVVTAFALGGCAAAEVMDGLAALLSVLAAALTGFLMHNWAPARTVAGRCGALFTGFVLASAAVLVHAGREPLGSAGALFALTAVATADGVLVLAGRLRGGRPGPGAGRRGLAHRLRGLGLTARGAAVVIGAASFASALVGLLIDLGWAGPGAACWVAGAAGVSVLGLLRVRVPSDRGFRMHPDRGTRPGVVPPPGASLRVRSG